MAVTPQTTLPLKSVRELAAGDKITGFYLLAKIEVKQKKDGSPYLAVQLQDSTGHIDGKFWENFAEFQSSVTAGDVAKIEGTLDFWQKTPQLTLFRGRKATEEEVPDRRSYLPHSPLSAEEARKQITAQIASVKNASLQLLLKSIFEDEEILHGFLEAPGGKMWHHAALGGLAEHTLSLVRLVDGFAAIYPALNRDLLVTGAFLHDLGKIFEFSTDVAIDYSLEGRLLGHIVQGTLVVEKKIADLPDFPMETRRQVLHLILSHQGDPSMASPVRPMTLEALALHYGDELDSRMDAFLREKAKTPEGQDLSDYIKLMERYFYFRPIEDSRETAGENS